MNKIDEYNQNPNYCRQCNKPIICNDPSKLYYTKQKKFCNSSCAASFNNKNIIRNKNGKPENFIHKGKNVIKNNKIKKKLIHGYKQEIPDILYLLLYVVV